QGRRRNAGRVKSGSRAVDPLAGRSRPAAFGNRRAGGPGAGLRGHGGRTPAAKASAPRRCGDRETQRAHRAVGPAPRPHAAAAEARDTAARRAEVSSRMRACRSAAVAADRALPGRGPTRAAARALPRPRVPFAARLLVPTFLLCAAVARAQDDAEPDATPRWPAGDLPAHLAADEPREVAWAGFLVQRDKVRAAIPAVRRALRRPPGRGKRGAGAARLPVPRA